MRILSGAALPCTADRDKPAGELKAAVLHHCGLPPETADAFGLSLGFAALHDAAPLRQGDVHEGDALTLNAKFAGPRECG